MPRCAVLGKPIAHSLSPVMHRAAYAYLGLSDWAYEAHEVDAPELAAFVHDMSRGWRGLSLTMPLKREAARLVDAMSAGARAVGAVNTILPGVDGTIFGDNTDISGAVAALGQHGIREVRSAAVVGAGATAVSVTAALQQLGLRQLTTYVRDAARATDLTEFADVPVEVRLIGDEVEPVDLVVSTVPSAAVEAAADALVRHAGAVFDAVYDPWPTALAVAAGRVGIPVISGVDLLAHQAVLQVALMTGHDVPVHILRDAALRALASR